MNTTNLVLGAMKFGTTIDEHTSFALLDRFVERGGIWIDTANCYSFWAGESGFGGHSEALIGRWLKARADMRSRVKISTKVGAEPREAGNWPASREGLSARAIRDGVSHSLERLGVDHVDLLWAHMEDRAVPIEQSAEALSSLVDDGVAGRVGASNHPAWRIERARAHLTVKGGHPFTAMQMSHSYLRTRQGALPASQSHRFGMMSDEHLDYADENGLELWAYTPLLGGAYDNPEKTIDEAYDHSGTARKLNALDRVAAELDASRGQVVLAWLLSDHASIRPILGGSKLSQLEAALDAAALDLTAEQRLLLDKARA